MGCNGGVDLSADYSRSMSRAQSRDNWTWLVPALIFGGSAFLYSINLARLPHPDELYHVLAARGLLAHGEPRIAEGLYTRVFAFTWLVSQMFALLGESLTAARLPSLVAMATLNTMLFLWLRSQAGSLAAWLGAALFALSPFTLEIAQFARFYAFQSLFFFAGCIIVHSLVRRPLPVTARSSGLAAAAALLFALALYTQITTLIGLLGLALWLATVLVVPWLLDPALSTRRKIGLLAILLVIGAALLGALLATGLLAEFWHRYRSTPIFLAPRADEFWFYHAFYLIYYPSLWPIIGLLCLAALATWPRPTWFAMVVFATGFLLNSFAGAKNLRYVAYAQPFLFILFGLGLAAIVPWLRRAADAFGQQLETHLAGFGLAGRGLPRMLLWASLLVALVANAAFLRTATLLADVTVPPQIPAVRWPEARPLVEPLLSEVDVVVTMAELETLYFWERYDILFSPSRLTELADQTEFSADHRTGRPVITTSESLRRVVDCTSSGLFISNTHRWGRTNLIDQVTAEFVETTMTRLDLPPELQLVVFAWDHSPVSTADDCAAIAEIVRGPDE